jgi:hypothetical protein
MIKGTTKREPKNDVCHFTIVLEVMFQKLFPLGVKSQKKKKQGQQLQEEKRRKYSLKERFIKNKRPLNPTHISSEKEKQQKTGITRRAILMSNYDDDEEGTPLQKR